MVHEAPMQVLERWTPGAGEPGWAEVVVGYDFSLLTAADIQRWLRLRGARGPAGATLIALRGEDLLDFGLRLWEACAEETGGVPRPGTRTWARAQDRWRKALLRARLDGDVTETGLAAALESVYDQVGCPEDMLGLWTYRAPWQPGRPRVDFRALLGFLGDPLEPCTAVA